MTRPALLLVAILAVAGCATPSRDPQADSSYAGIRDRIERDREEIDRQVRSLDEPDAERRAKRLAALDAALDSLFAVQSRAMDAQAEGDAEALREAAATLDAVERSIR